MKAMILAAGAGTRLRPLTNTVPKPLCPIANVPLLHRTLLWLSGQGIREVAVNASYLAEEVVTSLGDGSAFGLTAHVSVEHHLLGTSGAVQRCADYFRDEPFFVVYGD